MHGKWVYITHFWHLIFFGDFFIFFVEIRGGKRGFTLLHQSHIAIIIYFFVKNNSHCNYTTNYSYCARVLRTRPLARPLLSSLSYICNARARTLLIHGLHASGHDCECCSCREECEHGGCRIDNHLDQYYQ